LGYNLDIDGIHGPITEYRIEAFQADKGLAVNSVVALCGARGTRDGVFATLCVDSGNHVVGGGWWFAASEVEFHTADRVQCRIFTSGCDIHNFIETSHAESVFVGNNDDGNVIAVSSCRVDY